MTLASPTLGTEFRPLRFALRELRGGLHGFRIFVACIALGVMAIAGVGSFSRSLTDGLARALAPDPAILVADEPTGNLDETTGRQIVDLLFTKHAERGMTLVLVTHDSSLAQRCDRVVRLRSGRIDGHGA